MQLAASWRRREGRQRPGDRMLGSPEVGSPMHHAPARVASEGRGQGTGGGGAEGGGMIVMIIRDDRFKEALRPEGIGGGLKGHGGR